MEQLRVLFLESFFGGSHRAFAEGYRRRSRHALDLRTLPGREWRRRQRLAGAAFASQIGPLEDYDVVLATDLLDLGDFRALATGDVPIVLYMHESQCTYPLPKGRSHDADTVFFDLKNAVMASRIIFNSETHRGRFLETVAPYLQEAGEIPGASWYRHVEEQSSVIYPGVDVAALRGATGATGAPPHGTADSTGAANIVWNHRWEYDKNPPAFFRALDALTAPNAGRGPADFTLTVLGENPQAHPRDFEAARERLAGRIRHFGYAEDRREYLQLLRKGDLVVSTARQENFGIAVVEAVAAGCHPLLPARLSYPEIIPPRFHGAVLYHSDRELQERLRALTAGEARSPVGRARRAELAAAMLRYDWSEIAPALDEALAEAAGSSAV